MGEGDEATLKPQIYNLVTRAAMADAAPGTQLTDSEASLLQVRQFPRGQRRVLELFRCRRERATRPTVLDVGRPRPKIRGRSDVAGLVGER